MTKLTIPSALERAAATYRGIRVIEHDNRSIPLSYAALLDESLTIAAALQAHGLRPGDRVALVMPEVSDFIRAFFGITAAGLVPVPLFPPAQAGDLPTFTRQSEHVLRASRAAAVVTSTHVAPLLEASAGDAQVLCLDALRGGAKLSVPVSVPLDSLALLQFTSGSTAAPKGVMLTHANLSANVAAIIGAEGLDLGPDDVGVSWLPLYHDMGLIGMLLTALYVGADIVIMSPVLFLKRPTAWLEAISTNHATVSFAPNFAYELCLRRVKPSQIDTLDLSSWRVAGCGAEPIRSDTLLAFASQFARAGFKASSFVPSYGLAEHSLAVAFSRGGLTVDRVDADRLVRTSRAVPALQDGPAVRIVACGHAFPNHEIHIVDDQGRRLGERSVGNIIARGPSVMKGYFENIEATQESLRDGWLYTGDLGYMADGELFVCGRTKDVIIRQGKKYHPSDLESAIVDLPGIRPSGVVVFGINRPEQSDEVVAVVEARASLSSDALMTDVRRRVRETVGFELDRIIVAPPGTIPRTTSGKVRRTETRARLEAGTLLPGEHVVER